MDTISRENNSMLPIGGIIVGAIALALGLYLLAAVSKVKNQVADQQEKVNKIDDISAQVSAANSKADNVSSQIAGLQKSTQDAFNAVGNELGTIKGDVATLKEPRTHSAAKGGSKEPVVAGPGEYVIKSGDTLAKAARANGVSLSDLEAVNPGVDSKHLKVGQKIKLPEKK
jgi:LysM repeat protein